MYKHDYERHVWNLKQQVDKLKEEKQNAVQLAELYRKSAALHATQSCAQRNEKNKLKEDNDHLRACRDQQSVELKAASNRIWHLNNQLKLTDGRLSKKEETVEVVIDLKVDASEAFGALNVTKEQFEYLMNSTNDGGDEIKGLRTLVKEQENQIKNDKACKERRLKLIFKARRERDSWKETVANKQRTIDALGEKISDLHNTISRLQGEAQLRAYCVADVNYVTQARHAEAMRHVGVIPNHDLDEAKDRIVELERRLEASNNLNNMCKQRATFMGHTSDELIDIVYKAEEVDDLKKRLATATHVHDILRDANYYLRMNHGNGEVRRLKEINDKLRSAKEVAESKYRISEGKANAWQQEYDGMQHKLVDAEGRVHSKDDQLKGMQETVIKLQDEGTNLMGQVNYLKGVIGRLKDQLNMSGINYTR